MVPVVISLVSFSYAALPPVTSIKRSIRVSAFGRAWDGAVAAGGAAGALSCGGAANAAMAVTPIIPMTRNLLII